MKYAGLFAVLASVTWVAAMPLLPAPGSRSDFEARNPTASEPSSDLGASDLTFSGTVTTSPADGSEGDDSGIRRGDTDPLLSSTVSPIDQPSSGIPEFQADDSRVLTMDSSEIAAKAYLAARKRDKEIRVTQIKDHLLRTFKLVPKTPEEIGLSNRLYGLVNRYPTCGAPPNADADAWNVPNSIAMFFDMPGDWLAKHGRSNDENSTDATAQEGRGRFGTRMHETRLEESLISAIVGSKGPKRRSNRVKQPPTILSAKLRLFKMGRGEGVDGSAAMPVEPPVMACEVPADDSRVVIGKVRDFDPTLEKIKVEVYRYTAAVRKNHYKKKLLDTKMFVMSDSKWVDFDIRSAVVNWIERGQNFGIVIQVWNEDGEVLDASQFFSTLPCHQRGSNSSHERPSLGNILPAPVLDICSLLPPNSNSTSSSSHRHDSSYSGRSNRQNHHPHRFLANEADFIASTGHRRRHNHGSANSSKHPFNLQNPSPHRHDQSTPSPRSRSTSSPATSTNEPDGPIDTSRTSRSEDLATQSDTSTQPEQRPDETRSSFTLKKNHPLRDILSSIARAGKHQSTGQSRAADSSDDGDYSYDSEDLEDLRDAIIERVPHSESSRHRAHQSHHHRSLPSLTVSITSADSREPSSEVIRIVNQDR